MGATMACGRKILVMGLPGAGKTTLSQELAPLLGAVHFNADDVRANISRDLTFTLDDRIEQARRMKWLCEKVCDAGHTAIADFVCPTEETRSAFGSAFSVWVDRIAVGRFQDTNQIFVEPSAYDVRVTANGNAREWARKIAAQIIAEADHAKAYRRKELWDNPERALQK